MIIKVYESPTSTLEVVVKDATTDKVYDSFLYGRDSNLFYSTSDTTYYLNFTPKASLLTLEITSQAGVSTKQVHAHEEEFDGGKFYYLNWVTEASGIAPRSGKALYHIYQKVIGTTPEVVPYTENSNTLTFDSFSRDDYDSTSSSYVDGSGITSFKLFDGAAPGGSVGEDSGVVKLNNGYIKHLQSFSSADGVTIGFLHKGAFIFDSDSLSVDTSSGTIEVVVTDGINTVTVSLDTSIADAQSTLFTLDSNFFRMYVDDEFLISLDVSSLTTELSLNNIKLSYASYISEFFVEKYVKGVASSTTFWMNNKPRFIGSTKWFDYMIPTECLEYGLSETVFLVYAEYANNARALLKDDAYPTELPLRTGSWCRVWDILDSGYISKHGVRFDVNWKDIQEGFVQPRVFVPINNLNSFAAYLPVGAIYRVSTSLNNRTYRFVVPDQDTVRLGDTQGEWLDE